mgnify:CR=1 FL=1
MLNEPHAYEQGLSTTIELLWFAGDLQILWLDGKRDHKIYSKQIPSTNATDLWQIFFSFESLSGSILSEDRHT